MTEIEFMARLGLALLLAGTIGLERQWQRTAGFRTNALVTTGSATLCWRRLQPHM
jgi:uncharacterized membrane protein YhiD involved in acid resistance